MGMFTFGRTAAALRRAAEKPLTNPAQERIITYITCSLCAGAERARRKWRRALLSAQRNGFDRDGCAKKGKAAFVHKQINARKSARGTDDRPRQLT